LDYQPILQKFHVDHFVCISPTCFFCCLSLKWSLTDHFINDVLTGWIIVLGSWYFLLVRCGCKIKDVNKVPNINAVGFYYSSSWFWWKCHCSQVLSNHSIKRNYQTSIPLDSVTWHCRLVRFFFQTILIYFQIIFYYFYELIGVTNTSTILFTGSTCILQLCQHHSSLS
jgi:hypothetical protein